MTTDDQLLSLSEVAHSLGISVEGVRRRIRQGELTAVKLGERSTPAPLRVRTGDLRNYIDQHQVVRQEVA